MGRVGSGLSDEWGVSMKPPSMLQTSGSMLMHLKLAHLDNEI